jgi:hypothetical protein
MKRLFVILFCAALLVGVLAVPAYAGEGDCVNGGCEDTSFVWTCIGWTKVAVQAVTDALGINIHISGTVGPLPYTATTELARFRVALDGEYGCTGSCGYGVVSHTGTEVLNTTDTAGPYDIALYVPADTKVPHTIEVLVAQDTCVNCPRVGNAEVAPYTPPETCKVTGDIWYQCNSGAWLYGTGIMRDCEWCGGLNGRRVVRESYDCGAHYTWYDRGEKVDGPPQELGRYPCPGNCK